MVRKQRKEDKTKNKRKRGGKWTKSKGRKLTGEKKTECEKEKQ